MSPVAARGLLLLALLLPAWTLAQGNGGNDSQILAEMRAYHNSQNFGDAERHLAQAQKLLRPETTRAVRLAVESVQCMEDSYENEDPDGRLQQAANAGIAAARAIGATAEQGRFAICAGNVLMAKGQLDDARSWYEKTLVLARARHDRTLEADALNSRGTVASARGEFRVALLDYTRALELFEEQGQAVDALSVTNDLAVLYSRLGDHRQALVYYRAVATKLGPDAGAADRSALLGNMAFSYEELGDHALALEQIRQAKTLAVQSGDPMQVALIQRLAGRILASSGQPEAALAELLPAQRYLLAQGDRERAAQADLYTALALERLGRTGEALAHAQAARAVFQKNQSLGNLNLAQTLEARLLSTQGKFLEALQTMQAAQANAKQLAAQANDYRMITAQVALDVREQKAENARLKNEVRSQQTIIAERDRTRHWQRFALAASLLVVLVIAGWAWRQFRRAQRMRHLSLTDELTGLPNRRSIFAFGAGQLEHARRIRDPLTLMLLDIDHFKDVNDKFGHGAGDDVLRAVAASLVASMRHGSRVGRTGGEEFFAVLPHTASDDALLAADRLRKAISALRLQCSGQDLQVTASFGVVTVPPGTGDLDALYAKADAALYAAKHRGRDRAVHHRDLAASAATG